MIKKTQKKINPKALRKTYLQSIEDPLADDGVIIFEPEANNLDIDTDYLALSCGAYGVLCRRSKESIS